MSATLILGDCLEKMKALPDKSVDCFICDLPYGQLAGSGQEKKKRNIKDLRYDNDKNKQLNVYSSDCSWDIKIDLEAFWKQVERLARTDDTPVIHFCNTRFGIDLINSKPSWFRYDIVWDKGRGVSFLLANKMPMKSHEMIYVFSKKGAYYNRVDIEGEYKAHKPKESKTKKFNVYSSGMSNGWIDNGNDGTTRCATSVITVPNRAVKGNHPTEKPQALYEWLLSRYCRQGGTVLDPTAGSFNSILVAKRLGLDAIGIEMDEGFFHKGIQKFINEEAEKNSES